MTQELIANMLGVRREGVTEAAGKLQRAGLIRYSRGRIEVHRPSGAGKSGLRVLRGSQARVRSAALPTSHAAILCTFSVNRSRSEGKPRGSAPRGLRTRRLPHRGAGPANPGSFCAVEHGRRPQRPSFSSRDQTRRSAGARLQRPASGPTRQPSSVPIAFHGSPQCPIQEFVPVVAEAAGKADGSTEVRRQNALLKAGALQNAILTSANFSIIATDEKGIIQLFNVGAERMLGYRAAEVVNRISPSDIHDPQEVMARAAGAEPRARAPPSRPASRRWRSRPRAKSKTSMN